MSTKFLFYHIPKTAGSSLEAFFNAVFGEENAVNLNAVQGENRDIIKQYTDRKVISGHFNNIGEVEDIFKDRFSIVFLREPVARFISQYYFEQERKKDSKENPEEDNLHAYTKALLPAIFRGTIDHVVNRQVCVLSDNNIIMGRKRYKQAEKNLARFSFIGLTEKSDESVDLFLRKANIDTDKKLPTRNKGNYGNKKKVRLKTLIFIKLINRLDVKLYKYALKQYKIRKKQIESL